MIARKKKLRIIQLTLLFAGILIIYYTYYDKKLSSNQNIISTTTKKKIENATLSTKKSAW